MDERCIRSARDGRRYSQEYDVKWVLEQARRCRRKASRTKTYTNGRHWRQVSEDADALVLAVKENDSDAVRLYNISPSALSLPITHFRISSSEGAIPCYNLFDILRGVFERHDTVRAFLRSMNSRDEVQHEQYEQPSTTGRRALEQLEDLVADLQDRAERRVTDRKVKVKEKAQPVTVFVQKASNGGKKKRKQTWEQSIRELGLSIGRDSDNKDEKASQSTSTALQPAISAPVAKPLLWDNIFFLLLDRVLPYLYNGVHIHSYDVIIETYAARCPTLKTDWMNRTFHSALSTLQRRFDRLSFSDDDLQWVRQQVRRCHLEKRRLDPIEGHLLTEQQVRQEYYLNPKNPGCPGPALPLTVHSQLAALTYYKLVDVIELVLERHGDTAAFSAFKAKMEDIAAGRSVVAVPEAVTSVYYTLSATSQYAALERLRLAKQRAMQSLVEAETAFCSDRLKRLPMYIFK